MPVRPTKCGAATHIQPAVVIVWNQVSSMASSVASQACRPNHNTSVLFTDIKIGRSEPIAVRAEPVEALFFLSEIQPFDWLAVPAAQGERGWHES